MDESKSVTANSASIEPRLSGQVTSGLRVLNYLPAICMVGLFVSGVGVVAHFFASEDAREHWQQPRTVDYVVKGQEALAIEEIFKDVFPIKDFSTGLLNAISLAVFDETRKGLVKGDDGWFFSDEEFSWNRKSAAMVEKHFGFVQDAIADLEAAGVEPIILLIPEKADIYRDKLGSIRPPASRATFYDEIRTRLTALGVQVPDLRTTFLEARKGTDVFLKADTHWTVAGAGVGAREVASSLAADTSLAREPYTLSAEPEVPHSGDLLKFANLSIFSGLVALPQETITPVSAKKAEADLDDLLADGQAGPQLAVVGSSYSANATWSFEAQLKAATGVEVINFAEEGKGPFKPMETFLSEKLPSMQGLKYVVWEMPLRYFDEVKY
jgi:alginate O-acetyltransferase complex protein AlgJ